MYQVLHVRYRYMWLKDMIPRVPVPQVGDTLGSMSLSHRYCWIRTCNTKSIFLEVHVLGTAWLNMYQEPGPQERRYSCNCMSRFVPWFCLSFRGQSLYFILDLETKGSLFDCEVQVLVRLKECSRWYPGIWLRTHREDVITKVVSATAAPLHGVWKLSPR